ncbi:MAG TPA: 2-oxo-4-hydroxy-4-carboxy-5-ureidoimidazoline decarboxylase [Pyrinomonadaceae bacterium]|jgi:2-oxo-4-hydroxy-4-carboxy-5-ureidoimidazoline decarboxylase
MELNSLPANAAESQLLKCCGSTQWAQRMVAARPFKSLLQLIEESERIWWSLDPADWLEAFHSHPKIGEKKAAATVAREAQQWSEAEQASVREASAETTAALGALNETYERKFGYIFIVCATGKSSEEMLAILRERLPHDKDEELRIAAAEQAKITELRLRKLLST